MTTAGAATKPAGTARRGFGTTLRLDRWSLEPAAVGLVFTRLHRLLADLVAPLPARVRRRPTRRRATSRRSSRRSSCRACCRPGSRRRSSSSGSRSASGRPATTTARPTTARSSSTRPPARWESRPSTAATRWRPASPSSSRTCTASSCTWPSSRSSSCGWTPSSRSATRATGGSAWAVILLVVNAALLTGYSLSCHSLRHLVGGRPGLLLVHRADPGAPRALAAPHEPQLACTRVWAWASLFSVVLADVYVRLLAVGAITDPAIRF